LKEKEQKAKIAILKTKILAKSQNLMNQTIHSHVVNKYKRNFTVEWGVDAKAFCNYYHDFYLCGSSV
jgi:hypothetical protein